MVNPNSRPLLEPGQRVAVFLDDAASGATLGYFGEYFGLPFPGSSGHEHRDGQLLLRVFVPFLRTVIDVQQCNVLPCGESRSQSAEQLPLGQSRSASVPFGSIRFLSPVQNDNEEIKGFFRIGDGPWNHFCFIKTCRPHISYEFSAPVNGLGVADGILYYEVPRTWRLDRAFLLQALTEIMGIEITWTGPSPEAVHSLATEGHQSV